MRFDKNDLKRIGKNFKYIRLAFGYKTQTSFAKDLGQPGFSYDMIKKYEGGKYNISAQTVRDFSLLVGFPFDEIAFGDLSYLEQNSLVGHSFSLDDFLSDDEFIKVIFEGINTIFPLFSNEKCLSDCNFSKAFDLSINILSSVGAKEEEFTEAFNEAADMFGKAGYPESFLNIMSLIGRYYVLFIFHGMRKETFEKLSSERYANYFEFRKAFYKRSADYDNVALLDGVKRQFLDTINDNLTICMKQVAEIEKYKDYVYYYLAVRYYFGFMDNETTRMSDTEMNSFGISLLDSLETIGNKYAETFNKTILKGWYAGASRMH